MGHVCGSSAAAEAGGAPMLDRQSQAPTEAGGDASAAQGAVACLAQSGAAASAAVEAGEPPVLGWQSPAPTEAGGDTSAVVAQEAVACLAQPEDGELESGGAPKTATRKLVAASAAVEAGEPPMLDWQSQAPTDAGGDTSAAVAQGAVACLAQQVVLVSIAVTAQIAASNASEASKQVGKVLNEALSSTKTDSSTKHVAETAASLKEVPFTRYTESTVVALKVGIPLDKFEMFIKHRIAPRYNLPSKHIEELCESMFCDLNQVSITEFAFKMDEDDELLSHFTFCRMVVFRREKANRSQVCDLGYCMFKISFTIGDETITKKIMEEASESIRRNFLWWTLGYDSKTASSTRAVEEAHSFQLSCGRQEEIQDYFRHKAVQAIRRWEKKGDVAEVTQSHSGMSPIKDDD